LIAPGERYRKGEFEFFQLMLPFNLFTGLEMAARGGCQAAAGRDLAAGAGVGRRGLRIGMQTMRESHG